MKILCGSSFKKAGNSILHRHIRGGRLVFSLCVLIVLSTSLPVDSVRAQGGQTLFGDVRINDAEAVKDSPGEEVTLILYSDVGGEVARQTVANHSRYRFINLRSGDYELAAVREGNEIARMRISMAPGSLSNSPYGFRQDLEFNWKSKGPKSVAGTISAADAYNRSAPHQAFFQKAQEAVAKKKYDQALALLKQIVDEDKLDFQVWTLMGTVYLVQEKRPEAEQSYLSAIEARPAFTLALLDLGRLRVSLKKFQEAIDPLTRAIESQPKSAEANFLLGEAYIQIRKGSKAIPYLNEAAQLGQADAHLRLGWLYNAAGLKDKAALEYEQFLKKKPDYPDRQKLAEYVKANRKD